MSNKAGERPSATPVLFVLLRPFESEHTVFRCALFLCGGAYLLGAVKN